MHPPGPLGILRGHNGEISALCHASSPLLLSGDSSGVVMRWNVTEREALSTHEPHVQEHPVISILNPPGGPTLVHYRNGDILRMEDRENAVMKNIFAPGFCQAKAVANGKAYLVGAGGECDLVRWVDRAGDIVCQSEEGKGMIMWIEDIGDGVVAGYEDGWVRYWDARMGTSDSIWECKAGEVSVCGVARGHVVVCGGVGGIWALKEGKILVAREGGRVGCVGWREDGKALATGRWDGVVGLWSGKRKQGKLLKPLGQLKWHERSSLGAIAWGSMDGGGLLATGAKDKTIALWKLFRPSQQDSDDRKTSRLQK